MGKNKKIGKKIRFEIFKRDRFTCQYCGQTAPAAVLQIDHLIPKSKGGSNDISNLITACFECNIGKSNIKLDESEIGINPLTIDFQNEKLEQLRNYAKFVMESEEIQEELTSFLIEKYDKIVLDNEGMNNEENTTVNYFAGKIQPQELLDIMRKTANKMSGKASWQKLKFFAGCCWKIIKGEGEE